MEKSGACSFKTNLDPFNVHFALGVLVVVKVSIRTYIAKLSNYPCISTCPANVDMSEYVMIVT